MPFTFVPAPCYLLFNETTASFYGYMLRKEVSLLRLELTELQAADESLRGIEFMGGFLDELIGWLKSIEDAKKELWFYCY